MRETKKTYDLNGTELEISTGKLATLSSGAVLLKMGGTSVLATTSIDKKDAEQDFFPLSVEYIEKMYARGAISGSRFEKREGFPSEEAIIKARQVDHSIRSLFPKSYRKPVMVVLTVMSYDQENDPEILAVFGASLSLLLSGAPFYGPSSSVVTCIKEDGSIVLNPKVSQHENLKAEFLISGLDDRALNMEGWGIEIPEDIMDKTLDSANEVIKRMNEIQLDFVKEAGVELNNQIVKEADLPVSEELITRIKTEKSEEIKKALFVEKDKDTNRGENLRVIKDSLFEEISKEGVKEGEEEVTPYHIDLGVEYVARKILRMAAMEEGKRVTKRGLEDIRDLSAEIDILPTVHGSALFCRGLTQSLSIVTLGSLAKEQMIDEMEGESTKRFMHHYNMPPFSTGEAGRYSYKPGRREIGHGAIGENALRNMIPSEEEFPYTIRVVSEILTSNGSTSMAATCASSMALMAAGVPIKQQVAGIGVGLITNDQNEDDYKLLLDIEGIEDFYGDMDFKVTGTSNGITAIQYENKLRGVKLEVLKKAFRLAQKGRMQVLEVMNKAISEPRKEISPTAPIVDSITIKQDSIGMLIGPGGKNIKEIVAQSSEYGSNPADINIDDSGKVMITASNKSQLDFVKNYISDMLGEAEINKVYEGIVDRIMPYGVFVDVTSNISGLLHISEIFEKPGNFDLTKVFTEGERIKVKVVKIEDGKVSFSIKGVEESPELMEKIENAPVSERTFERPQRDDRRGNFRGGDRDRQNSGYRRDSRY